jgi:hypothetical protein
MNRRRAMKAGLPAAVTSKLPTHRSNIHSQPELHCEAEFELRQVSRFPLRMVPCASLSGSGAQLVLLELLKSGWSIVGRSDRRVCLEYSQPIEIQIHAVSAIAGPVTSN